MKKRLIAIICLGIILLAGAAIAVSIIQDNAQKVDFEDEAMAEIISISAGVESVDKFRVDDLEKVETLNIGYTGYYDTLVDIEKCPNLRKLIIGYPDYRLAHYYFTDREMPELESKERVKQIEKELGSILEKCPNLTTIYISNEKGNCELDNIEFLKKGKNLTSISLYYQTDIDYSIISECNKLSFLALDYCDISDLGMIGELEHLEDLYIEGTNVSEAKDILKLKKLNHLEIADTPLAENEEQLELIYKQFPEANIYNGFQKLIF